MRKRREGAFSHGCLKIHAEPDTVAAVALLKPAPSNRPTTPRTKPNRFMLLLLYPQSFGRIRKNERENERFHICSLLLIARQNRNIKFYVTIYTAGKKPAHAISAAILRAQKTLHCRGRWCKSVIMSVDGQKVCPPTHFLSRRKKGEGVKTPRCIVHSIGAVCGHAPGFL